MSPASGFCLRDTPIEIVSAVCAALPDGGGRPAIRRWFTPETRWVNEGLAITPGVDEAIALIDGFEDSVDIAAIHIDMLTIAANGSHVLTKRLDRFDQADGTELGRAMVMGIFEVEGDKIIAWRDYFDVNVLQKFAAAQ